MYDIGINLVYSSVIDLSFNLRKPTENKIFSEEICRIITNQVLNTMIYKCLHIKFSIISTLLQNPNVRHA